MVFHERDVRDNQYAVQVHNDLINGVLGSIGWNSDEIRLLRGTDPRNSQLFFTELNEEQVNTVVSQFGSKPRFQIQPVEWYHGANLTNMSAVYQAWINKAQHGRPCCMPQFLQCFGRSQASCNHSQPLKSTCWAQVSYCSVSQKPGTRC